MQTSSSNSPCTVSKLLLRLLLQSLLLWVPAWGTVLHLTPDQCYAGTQIFFTCPADDTIAFTSLHGIFFPTNNEHSLIHSQQAFSRTTPDPAMLLPVWGSWFTPTLYFILLFFHTHSPFYGLLFQPVKTICNSTSGSLKSVCSSSQLKAPYQFNKHTLSIPSFKPPEQNKTEQSCQAHPSRLPLNSVFQAVVDSHIKIYPMLCSLSCLEVDLCCIKDSQT